MNARVNSAVFKSASSATCRIAGCVARIRRATEQSDRGRRVHLLTRRYTHDQKSFFQTRAGTYRGLHSAPDPFWSTVFRWMSTGSLPLFIPMN